jgi:hypothetical protein
VLLVRLFRGDPRPIVANQTCECVAIRRYLHCRSVPCSELGLKGESSDRRLANKILTDKSHGISLLGTFGIIIPLLFITVFGSHQCTQLYFTRQMHNIIYKQWRGISDMFRFKCSIFREKNQMPVLTFYSLEVIARTTSFNIQKFYMVLTMCWVFCMGFYLVQHWQIGFCVTEVQCFLRGAHRVLI